MAQSGVALKQSFSNPTETAQLMPAMTGISRMAAGNEGDEEDLGAINAAVNELIRLESRGQRLDLHVENARTVEALQTIAERFRIFGLSHQFSETIIGAIENCIVSNGASFARKNRSEILSVHLTLTDKKPDLTKGRSHLVIAFDGQQKFGGSFSTVQMHYTNTGTKTTTTSIPDLENMFVNKTKYLVFTYEGREGEALDSPENIAADLAAIAAGGAMPVEAVEQLQAAIENGTLTVDQADLIQAVAELNRVMEIMEASPGSIENPTALIERLRETIGQTMPSQNIPPALADVAAQSVRKMEITVSSPEFTAIVTQGKPVDIIADNDNSPAAENSAPDISELAELLEQAGLNDAVPVTLTSEQQVILMEMIGQIDMPAADRTEILHQISEGTIERATFSRMETAVTAEGISVPESAAAVIAEIQDTITLQDKILPALADQKIFLTEEQQQKLQEVVAKQDVPQEIAEVLAEQVKTQSVTVETIALLATNDKITNLPVVEVLHNDARQVVREQQSHMDVPVSVPLTPVVKEAVISAVQEMNIPAPAKSNFTAEVQNEAPSRSLLNAVNIMAPATPALDAFRDQSARQFTRDNVTQLVAKLDDHARNLPPNAPPETKKFIQNVVTDLQNGRSISWVNQVKIAQMDPKLAVAVAGTQSFTVPPRRPELLIDQMKQAQQIMTRTSPAEAKEFKHIIERMEADPKRSVEIFNQAISVMPAEGKLFKGLVAAVEKVQPTAFQPREGQREKLVKVLEEAKSDLPREKQAVFDRVIEDIKLGNPVERKDLDAIVKNDSKLIEPLSSGLTPDKTIKPAIKDICDNCPHGGNCAECGKQFKPAAKVVELKRDEQGKIITPKKDLG